MKAEPKRGREPHIKRGSARRLMSDTDSQMQVSVTSVTIVYRGDRLPITDCFFLALSMIIEREVVREVFFSSLRQKQQSLYTMQKKKIR